MQYLVKDCIFIGRTTKLVSYETHLLYSGILFLLDCRDKL